MQPYTRLCSNELQYLPPNMIENITICNLPDDENRQVRLLNKSIPNGSLICTFKYPECNISRLLGTDIIPTVFHPDVLVIPDKISELATEMLQNSNDKLDRKSDADLEPNLSRIMSIIRYIDIGITGETFLNAGLKTN